MNTPIAKTILYNYLMSYIFIDIYSRVYIINDWSINSTNNHVHI